MLTHKFIIIGLIFYTTNYLGQMAAANDEELLIKVKIVT